jgi:hypothetical protein
MRGTGDDNVGRLTNTANNSRGQDGLRQSGSFYRCWGKLPNGLRFEITIAAELLPDTPEMASMTPVSASQSGDAHLILRLCHSQGGAS